MPVSDHMERQKEYFDTRIDKKTEELQPEPPLENEVRTHWGLQFENAVFRLHREIPSGSAKK